ncbi:type II secretion system F family protein [Ornithinimicrobium sp. LYQ92]|uniref:type II secretion system F family protein n=1 Tax=Serinicoccus sp. LYQ92 TaxID=3378798 RepID=UPI00385316F0
MLTAALLLGLVAASSVLLLPGPARVSRQTVVDEETDARSVHADRDASVLAVLDDLSAGLEAGLPVPRAVSLALTHRPMHGPGHEAWSALDLASRDGQGLAPAWARLARATGSPAVGSVARAWRVAGLTGAPLSVALRVSATTARERLRLERAVSTATAGARATASVLTVLPLAGVLLAAVLGVGPATLYGSAPALASAGLGTLLLLAGQVLVRAVVGRVLRDLR